MFTFAEYWRAYQATRVRLEAEYYRLPLQEKSRRVLGRENHLLYSSQAVTAKMSSPSLSSPTIESGVEQQLWQFESIAYHALVCVPLRRIPLPDTRWIFLDLFGQAGGGATSVPRQWQGFVQPWRITLPRRPAAF